MQLGEGVPDSRKGLFPSHSTAVAKFLKGCVGCSVGGASTDQCMHARSHITLQARSEADVAPAHILK